MKSPASLQGVILKCVDGRWVDGDGLTPADTMVVIGITRALQCWGKDKDLLDVIVERPNEPLPHADDLNGQIPQNEWGLGLDGKPRPPWSLNWVVYLLDPATASVFTFINNTTGARIAVERLEDRIRGMKWLRGNNVTAIVKLDSRPMRTSFGQKMRPEFTIVEWRDLSDDAGGALLQLSPRGDGGNTPLIEHKAAEPKAAEPTAAPQEIKPKIGPDVIKPAESAEALAKAKQKAKAKIGKDVKPTTVSEEIDDGLPFDLAPPI